MNQRVIDISIPMKTGMVAWPGSPQFGYRWTMRLEKGDTCNNSCITTDAHAGTHVDAPLHFVGGGGTVEALNLDVLVGPAVVVELLGRPAITAKDLKDVDTSTGRILIRTDNSVLRRLERDGFDEKFVGLMPDASQWLVDHGVRLVGVDFLSVQPFGGSPDTHTILLGAGVIILEAANLADVKPGRYELICLPLKIPGAEAAPARTILRTLS